MKLKIWYRGHAMQLTAERGDSLISLLRNAGIAITAPCGGNGVCRKCRVEIKGEGEVLACQYTLDHVVEVIVPELPDMQILTESYFPEWIKTHTSNLITHDSPLTTHGSRDFGLALDIGTTTCVLYLENLHSKRNIATVSFMNPQQRFGADVMSRIQYCRENENGTEELHHLIVEAVINELTGLCQSHQVNLSLLKKMAVVGNTTMLHLFKGVSPAPLAEVPFTPVFLEQQVWRGLGKQSELSELEVILLPSLSAYVGADIVAGLAAMDWPGEGEASLFVDIGTNGEMALMTPDRIVTCATAAGPAFEGASITCGVGGVEGAIHKVTPEGWQSIGQKSPLGICGSGLLDAVALMLKQNLIDLTGFLESDYTLVPPNSRGKHPEIKITPSDIREVQLAKGAIAAGIAVLMEKLLVNHPSSVVGRRSSVNRLYLAGGFGYALNPESATLIGLIPESLSNNVIRAGNTAGLGARLFLHSDEFHERLKHITAHAEYIDLSTDSLFNEAFIEQMSF